MNPGTESGDRTGTPPAQPRTGHGPGRPITSDSRAAVADYLGMLARRKWLASGTFLVVMGLTVFSIVRTRPVYEARATMMVGQQQDQSGVLSMAAAMPASAFRGNYVDNCIELLRSWSMAQKVAGQMPDSLGLSAGMLQSMVTARQLRQTDIIELVAACPSRGAAVAAANAYVEAYEQYDLEQSRAEVSATRQFIEQQLAVAGPRLDSSERNLEDYKTAHRVPDLDAETKALIDQQAGVAASLQEADAEIKANEAQLAQVQSQIEQAGDTTADKLQEIGSPLVSSLQNSLNQLEVQKANLLIGGFAENSQRVRDLDRQVDSTRAQLNNAVKTLISQQQFTGPGQLSDRLEQALTLSTGLTAARARRQALQTALSRYSASIEGLPETERVLAGLTRDAETAERINSLLSERYEEARIQEAGRMATVRIVDRARGAGQTKPDVPHTLSYGLLLALALALGSVWVAEYLDTSIHGPRELERRGYTVLGSVPQLPSAGRSRPRRNGSLTSHLITHTDVESSGAEAFRILRTGLAFANAERPMHTIAVTSPEPGEGKSTVAVNLAAVLAQAGSRVLLVDADMRHPALNTAFEHDEKPGFSDLVVNGGEPFQAIFPTSLDGLSCLPCGTPPPSPADLFTLKATRDLLRRLELDYDYVVIDTPPALVAADTPIITALADTTILVVRAGRTKFDALENARAAILSGGAHLSGIVANDVKSSDRYGRYHYYHKYHRRYAVRAAAAVQPGKEDTGRTA